MPTFSVTSVEIRGKLKFRGFFCCAKTGSSGRCLPFFHRPGIAHARRKAAGASGKKHSDAKKHLTGGGEL
jgi:hypothetical protein